MITIYDNITTTYKLISLRRESDQIKIEILHSIFEQTLFDKLKNGTSTKQEYERIDNWVETKNGWYIGITLKRTLRERWKQTYTTDDRIYEQHKIKKILWVISDDSDLSEQKIVELVSYRHIFFIPHNSRVLKNLQFHPEIGRYLFPVTDLIRQVRELIETE